jgi:hypothetical protein
MNVFSYTIASIIEYFFVTENLDVKAYPLLADVKVIVDGTPIRRSGSSALW